MTLTLLLVNIYSYRKKPLWEVHGLGNNLAQSFLVYLMSWALLYLFIYTNILRIHSSVIFLLHNFRRPC